MKNLLVVLFFLPLAGNAQSQSAEAKIDSLESVWNALSDSLLIQRAKIMLLVNELEDGRAQSAAEIAALRKENEMLRQIMIGYIKSIDEFNMGNQKLEEELDDCKKSK